MATVRDEEKFQHDSQAMSRQKDGMEQAITGNTVTTAPLDGATPADSLDLHSEEKSFASEELEVTYPDGGLRAWLVVFGASCITFSTFGFVNSWGVFQAYYEREILPTTPESSIAWIGSLQYSLVFLPGLVTGRIFDLGIFRLPLFIACVILVGVTIAVAECTQYWHFLLAQGIIIGLCCGAIFGPTLGVVAHWFNRKRSTAYGFVAVGSSIGGTVIPIAVRNLIPIVGFKWTMRIVALILACTLSIANLALRRRLEARPRRGAIVSFHHFRSLPFSLYVISSFFGFLGIYTPLTFMDTSAVAVGISPAVSFYFISIANAASLLGRVSTGFLADRYGPINIMIPFTLVAAVMTYAWPFASTVGTLVVISLLYGAASGAFVSVLPSPVTNFGDISDVGERVGLLFTVAAVAALAGPPISGAINGATHDFRIVGAYAGSMVVLCVVFMQLSRYATTGRIWGGKC